MKILNRKKYSIGSLISKYSFVFVLFLSLVMPLVFINADATTAIQNPIGGGVNDIPSFIAAIIHIVLVIGVPILVLAIIYAGFLFVKAQGKSEELTKAKNALLYTVIGGALLLGAFVIANAIGQTVADIGKGAQ